MQHRRCKDLTQVFQMLGEPDGRHFVPVRQTVDLNRPQVFSSTRLVDSARLKVREMRYQLKMWTDVTASNSENFWVNSPKWESNWIRAAPTKASICLLHEMCCRFCVLWSQRRNVYADHWVSEQAEPTRQGTFSKFPTNLSTGWQRLSQLFELNHEMDYLVWYIATQPDILTRGQPSFDGSGNKWRCFPLKLIPSSQINTFSRGRIILTHSNTFRLVSIGWNYQRISFHEGDTDYKFPTGK